VEFHDVRTMPRPAILKTMAMVDIGHYGRLVFAMLARHFLTEDELLEQLSRGAKCPCLTRGR
jgi:hypothetical protein